MDVVVLFGAGASYGAGGILPFAPPLGAQLYPALVKAYPAAWGALPADAAQAFTDRGFEAGMAYTWQRYSNIVSILQKALGHYFAHFTVSNGACAYRSLITGLGLKASTRKVMLATLNYELALDTCLQMEGVRFSLGDANAGAAVVLNKPHGACNIFNESLVATAGVSFTSGASFGGGDNKAIPQIDALQRNGGTANMIPPVLAIFMEGKPCQTSPELLQRWQREYAAALRSATRIAVIGVHPNPRDTHIWSPLAEATGELIYCGDEAAFNSWRSGEQQNGARRFICSKFAESVDDLVAALKA